MLSGFQIKISHGGNFDTVEVNKLPKIRVFPTGEEIIKNFTNPSLGTNRITQAEPVDAISGSESGESYLR